MFKENLGIFSKVSKARIDFWVSLGEERFVDVDNIVLDKVGPCINLIDIFLSSSNEFCNEFVNLGTNISVG